MFIFVLLRLMNPYDYLIVLTMTYITYLFSDQVFKIERKLRETELVQINIRVLFSNRSLKETE